MLPKKPPRVGQVGFIFSPPFRVQGVSIAGEQTSVQVPELDVVFDIGLCPRVALASPLIALSHAHMDHLGGLPYYFSQRVFQGMGTGRCVCHPAIHSPLQTMLESWHALEQQRTPFELIALASGDQVELKNNLYLRAMEVSHTVPALGYVVLEKRSKLREEFIGLPQTKLRELKAQGQEITRQLEVPLVAYTGDTELCPTLFSEEFCRAKVVISECTFYEDDHRQRAKVGKHLHARDLASLLDAWQAETVVLVHASRRTNLREAKEQLARWCGKDISERVHMLMDHRANSERYERQKQAAYAGSESGSSSS